MKNESKHEASNWGAGDCIEALESLNIWLEDGTMLTNQGAYKRLVELACKGEILERGISELKADWLARSAKEYEEFERDVAGTLLECVDDLEGITKRKF